MDGVCVCISITQNAQIIYGIYDVSQLKPANYNELPKNPSERKMTKPKQQPTRSDFGRYWEKNGNKKNPPKIGYTIWIMNHKTMNIYHHSMVAEYRDCSLYVHVFGMGFGNNLPITHHLIECMCHVCVYPMFVYCWNV